MRVLFSELPYERRSPRSRVAVDELRRRRLPWLHGFTLDAWPCWRPMWWMQGIELGYEIRWVTVRRREFARRAGRGHGNARSGSAPYSTMRPWRRQSRTSLNAERGRLHCRRGLPPPKDGSCRNRPAAAIASWAATSPTWPLRYVALPTPAAASRCLTSDGTATAVDRQRCCREYRMDVQEDYVETTCNGASW